MDSSSLQVLFYITPILLLILLTILYIFLREKKIGKQLQACIEDHLNIRPFLKKVPLKRLYLYSRVLEKVSSHKDMTLPLRLGMDRLWVDALSKKPDLKRMKRVLRFCSEQGLYEAFSASLDKPKLRPVFMNYLQEQKIEVVLNILSKMSFMQEFDGCRAADLLADHLEDVAVLSESGSPEDRWFSFRIAASLEDAHSQGEVKWEAFKDHNFEIRRMVIENINAGDDSRYFKALYDRLINDTEADIRSRVKEIIAERFSELYNPDFHSLTLSQQKHFSENFSVVFESDKKIAFELIQHENLELRQYAADFLNRTDALKKLILSVDINDPSRLNHSSSLLRSAIEVHSDRFLTTVCASKNPGTLMCAAVLLDEIGDRRNIALLARSVFDLRRDGIIDPHQSELYTAVLECIQKRGDEKAFDELRLEMLDNRYDSTVLPLLLAHIPQAGDVIFADMLLAFVRNPKIEVREQLLDACLKMPSEMVVSEMIRILKSGPQTPWQVRLNAVEFFRREKIELCFQYVLENLDFFPDDACIDAVKKLYDYSPELFTLTIEEIIAVEDSRTVTRIIEFLNVTGDASYIRLIKKSLENSSSQIRLSAIRGLFLYEYESFFESIAHLLNDPEKEVRLLAAKMMATSAVKKEIQEVRKIVLDENELKIVKKALVAGLGSSQNTEAVEILIEAADSMPELSEYLLQSLLLKPIEKISEQLVELYTESGDKGQKLICSYFRNKGLIEQEFLLELLKEVRVSQKLENIRDILYKTGFIDKTINRLRNKSSEIRISALNRLLIVDTFPAHKGILLAARDNNKAIRMVAFEKIESLIHKEPKAIDALKEDSSRMVQKNINWILNKMEKNRRAK